MDDKQKETSDLKRTNAPRSALSSSAGKGALQSTEYCVLSLSWNYKRPFFDSVTILHVKCSLCGCVMPAKAPKCKTHRLTSLIFSTVDEKGKNCEQWRTKFFDITTNKKVFLHVEQ